MFRRLIFIFALIITWSAAKAGPQTSTRAIAVPKANGAITIDGKLDELAWKTAGSLSPFVSHRPGGQPTNQTRARLRYDDKALYVAFQCAEKDMAHVKAMIKEHDGSLWSDDCVEFFLDTKGDRAGFVQFIMNSIGTKYDGLGNDNYGFNPKWDGKATTGKEGWTAEIRIPFSELGVRVPKPGDAWLGNFCREEQPSTELSSWCATNGSFSSTNTFGEIIFGDYSSKTSNDLAAAIHDIQELERSAQKLNVDASDLLSEARAGVQTAKSLIPKNQSLSEAGYLKIRSHLDGNRQLLKKVNDIVRRAEMGNADYLVWETTPWRHFSMREDYSSVRSDTKSVQAVVLAGQTDSKALMVTNLTTETLSARLLTSGFPEGSVDILIPTFVRSGGGAAFPDALVPCDPIGQLVVPPGETRQIWLNIKGAQPGKFEGVLTISPLTASKTDKQVEFAVEVVKPTAEVQSPLSLTWDYLGDAAERGMEDKYMQSMADHGISVFWISGLQYIPRPKADDEGNLLEPMDWSKFEREVRLKWKPGRKLYITCDVWEKANVRPIFNGKFDTPGWGVAFKKVIGEMAQVLKRMGLSYDDYMVNPLDESIDGRYIAIARLVKEADPSIKIVEDTIGENLDQVKEADKYTDYWIPHFKAYLAESNKPSIEYLKSNGKPLGFYFYSEGAEEKAQDSYHHYLWDFWFAYSQGLNGIFGYWTATQHYGNPWNRHQTTADYDPSLFYYGNGCTITGRRWEAWRRGIEDFALLKLCETSGVDKSVISRAVKSVMDAPNDPQAAEHARAQLIRALASK